MRFLVIGGTGTVGGEVVRLLKALGHEVRVLTGSAAKAGDLLEGVEAAVGDLADSSARRLQRHDSIGAPIEMGTERVVSGLLRVN